MGEYVSSIGLWKVSDLLLPFTLLSKNMTDTVVNVVTALPLFYLLCWCVLLCMTYRQYDVDHLVFKVSPLPSWIPMTKTHLWKGWQKQNLWKSTRDSVVSIRPTAGLSIFASLFRFYSPQNVMVHSHCSHKRFIQMQQAAVLIKNHFDPTLPAP